MLTPQIKTEFNKRFCPHRGLGEDNTLSSIAAALKKKPFLVEFDIQYAAGNLYLGHPPAINKDATLADALKLYISSGVMPKVDLKLNPETFSDGLKLLCSELSNEPQVLVNIDGDLTTDKFLEAEAYVLSHTVNNILLNIDLIRYKNLNSLEINKHIQSLARPPFSMSPNLESNIDAAINLAKTHQILHLHFWSFFDRQYSIEHLCSLMQKVLDSGLEVYFDIKTDNIQNNN